jgi:hypothetical protein
MKTVYNFGRPSPEQRQMPIAVSRLGQKMVGEKQEVLCPQD